MNKVLFLSVILLTSITTVVASEHAPATVAHAAAATKISEQQAQPVRRGSVHFDLAEQRKRKDAKLAQRYRDRLQNLNHFSPDESREFPTIRLSWDMD